MRARRTAGAFCLAFVLGGSACESETFDVTEDVSYDSAIGFYGTFDFYEPESNGSRATELPQSE